MQHPIGYGVVKSPSKQEVSGVGTTKLLKSGFFKLTRIKPQGNLTLTLFIIIISFTEINKALSPNLLLLVMDIALISLILLIILISLSILTCIVGSVWDCIWRRRVGVESHSCGQELQYDNELDLSHHPKATP